VAAVAAFQAISYHHSEKSYRWIPYNLHCWSIVVK